MIFHVRTFKGQTPLYLGVLNNKVEFVHALLGFKPSIDIISNEGNTVLHAAALRGCIEAAELLLGHFQPPALDEPNKEGYTPLHLACEHGHTELVRLLLSKGVSCKSKTDRLGWTALHFATENNFPEVVSQLLEAGAPIDGQAHDGSSPLFLAIASQREECFNLLVEKGASLTLTNSKQQTPLHVAMLLEYHNKALTLLWNDANPNAKDHFGVSPFMMYVLSL